MGPRRLEPGEVLRDCPTTRYMRRVLRNPRICSYVAAATGEWELCLRMPGHSGVVLELAGLGQEPTKVGRATLEAVLFDQGPTKYQWLHELASAIRGAQRQEIRDALEDAEYNRDLRQYLRRRAGIHRENDPSYDLIALPGVKRPRR